MRFRVHLSFPNAQHLDCPFVHYHIASTSPPDQFLDSGVPVVGDGDEPTTSGIPSSSATPAWSFNGGVQREEDSLGIPVTI